MVQVVPSKISEHANHMNVVRALEKKRTGVDKPADCIVADQGKPAQKSPFNPVLTLLTGQVTTKIFTVQLLRY